MSYVSIEYRPGKMSGADMRKLGEQPYATIDPGGGGAVVVRESGAPVGHVRLYPLFPSPLLRLNGEALGGVGLYVVEAQYMASNPMTSIRIARSAAATVAYAAGVRSVRGESTIVLWVSPAAWQAALRRRLSALPGSQPGREDGKALALRYAQETGLTKRSAYTDATKPVREGLCDAWGLSEFVAKDLWGQT